jgi:ligand-binding sensor domain-containing protein
MHDPENPNSPSSNRIKKIINDNKGNLWIATDNRGLLKYNINNKEWEKFRNQPNDQQSIADNLVRDVFLDKQGNLWLGMGLGLGKMDTLRKTFKTYSHQEKSPGSISNNDILCVFQDSYGTIWVGTSGGINALDKKTENFISLDETNGLPNSVVYSILEDNQKRLWFSTNKGLCVFTIPEPSQISKSPGLALKKMLRTLRNYDESEGLTSNEFNSGASFKDNQGYLYFGGVSGFVRFHPDSLEDNFRVPPVHITSLRVFGKEIPMLNTFKNSNQVELKYNENYLSFEFISLNYLSPTKTKFAYQLEGFDKEAIVGHSRRFAGYTNLEPGEYTFKVWVSANNGSWAGEPAELKITILPPFWKKAWFFIFISIVAAGTIWLFNFLRERKIRVDKIKLEKILDKLLGSNYYFLLLN